VDIKYIEVTNYLVAVRRITRDNTISDKARLLLLLVLTNDSKFNPRQAYLKDKLNIKSNKTLLKYKNELALKGYCLLVEKEKVKYWQWSSEPKSEWIDVAQKRLRMVAPVSNDVSNDVLYDIHECKAYCTDFFNQYSKERFKVNGEFDVNENKLTELLYKMIDASIRNKGIDGYTPNNEQVTSYFKTYIKAAWKIDFMGNDTLRNKKRWNLSYLNSQYKRIKKEFKQKQK